jgi:hypothetical protein|tara:strand:- start:301 stop:1026 length:726 start_codon:yes stop_codon:yes gene_type:complete
MKIVQSLTTTPYLRTESYIKKQLQLFECSIKMARRFHPVTLYTDERGANELGHLVDEVKFLEKNTDNYLWCEPKFEVFKRETGEFTHMDGDVFISEPLVIPKEYDVLYDCNEIDGGKYYHTNMNILYGWGVKEVFPHWNINWSGAYNVGLISFKSPTHMKMYSDTFYTLKDFYFKNSKLQGDKLTYIAMTLEQLSLKLLSDGMGWNSVSMDNINSYIHMYSVRKFNKGFMELIETMSKYTN